MVDLLPLFPLERVLVPGQPLPLHIFEARYVQMIEDATQEGGARRFGVVALKTGFEVQSIVDQAVPPQLAHVGTVAEILELESADDGTLQLIAAGSQRFTWTRLVPINRDYLLASVRFKSEPVGDVPPGLVESTQALTAEYLRLYGEAGGIEHGVDEDYPNDVALLAHRLAAEAPLSEADHQALLEDKTAGDRLRHLTRLLRREITLLRRTRTVAVSPSTLHRGLRPN